LDLSGLWGGEGFLLAHRLTDAINIRSNRFEQHNHIVICHNLTQVKEACMRETEYAIAPIFTERWSPRAMSGERVTDEELMTLFEAARWAPSSNNNQPWRFFFARRDSRYWEGFFGLLTEGNKVWCRNAAVLVVVVSKDTFDYNGAPARTHEFDAGASWGSLALQGSISGLVVHGMQGFDYDKAEGVLHLPLGYTVECMIAIGKPGSKEALPEYLQAREIPSDRRPLREIVFEGEFTDLDARTE
jgi:nitroreductase